MRRRRALACSAVLISVLAASPLEAAVLTDSLPAAGDSVAAYGEDRGAWLPVPEEDLESLEPLAEAGSDMGAGWLARASISQGRLRMRRVAALLRTGKAGGELGALWDETQVRPGGRVSTGRMSIAAGRVTVSRLPPLLADAMRLTRVGRSVIAPRPGLPAVAPSRGASAGAIDGGAVSARPGRAGLGFWSFAGVQADEGKGLGGVGLALGRGRTRAGAAFAMSAPAGRFGSITVARRDRALATAVEVFQGSTGRALLAEAVSRGEPGILTARWRYRSWARSKVAAEISAETVGPGSRVRMTWRSWSAGAEQDDGLLEMEWRGHLLRLEPVRIRLGGPERYGLIDATVAREPGRAFSVHALRRASSLRVGSMTLGGRLDLDGPLGAHALVIESTRIRRGDAAWGVALSPSGDVTLRSRSKPGLWVSGRGSVSRGSWQLGYELERGEDRSGLRPWSGSLWLRRNTD